MTIADVLLNLGSNTLPILCCKSSGGICWSPTSMPSITSNQPLVGLSRQRATGSVEDGRARIRDSQMDHLIQQHNIDHNRNVQI